MTFTEFSDGQSQLLVMRHNTDGSIDTSYGNEGYVYISPINTAYFSFDSEIVEDDNLIILAYTYGSAGGNLFLMKLDSNGNPITSFGNNGYVTYNTNGWTLVPRSLAIQDDGKIVVGGEFGDSNYISCILRYLPNGQLDTSFGDNGMFLNESFNFNGEPVESIGESVSIAPDGRIYLSGWYIHPDPEWGSSYDCKIICVDENGALVPTFGEDGAKVFSVSEVIDAINDSEVLPDGKLLVGGVAEIFVEEPGSGPKLQTFSRQTESRRLIRHEFW